MTNIQILLLSVLQGLTEFLPVSSSGHLILFSKFTSFPDQGLELDVAVHVGSIIAVMIYFWRDIRNIIVGLWQSRFLPSLKNSGSRLFWLIIIGTIPAVIVGFALKAYGIEEFRSAKLIGWTMFCYGFILYFADHYGRTDRKVDNIGIKEALLIGLAQCLALVPGTSRSGITITTARLLGLERREAARFSMLLSIPTIAGAGLLVALEIIQQGSVSQISDALHGVAYSFISSILAIYVIMWWLKKSTFTPFVIYRFFLGGYLLLDAYGFLS